MGEIRGKGLLVGIELDADPVGPQALCPIPEGQQPPQQGVLRGAAPRTRRSRSDDGGARAAADRDPEADADEIVARLGRAIDRVAAEVKAAGLAAEWGTCGSTASASRVLRHPAGLPL